MMPIKAYQTSDGKLFTDEKFAEQHQKELTLKADLQALIDRYLSSESSRDDVVQFIIQFGSTIHELLERAGKISQAG